MSVSTTNSDRTSGVKTACGEASAYRRQLKTNTWKSLPKMFPQYIFPSWAGGQNGAENEHGGRMLPAVIRNSFRKKRISTVLQKAERLRRKQAGT